VRVEANLKHKAIPRRSRQIDLCKRFSVPSASASAAPGLWSARVTNQLQKTKKAGLTVRLLQIVSKKFLQKIRPKIQKPIFLDFFCRVFGRFSVRGFKKTR
jgi:hypothetical protein